MSRRRSTASDDLPLERIIHIAEFRAALRGFVRRSERTAQRWGLTPQRYLLLLAIKGAPDGSERMSFTDLSTRLQLSRNTVTELCARAEEAGLIEREPADHDARVVYLRLTAEGDRRLCCAIRELDGDRPELAHAFEELAQTYRVSLRRPRRRA